MNSTVGAEDLSWSEIVGYVAQRLRVLGEGEAQLCALRFEENLGLDRNKLLAAAREQLNQETRP